jgi:hypothetical protein
MFLGIGRFKSVYPKAVNLSVEKKRIDGIVWSWMYPERSAVNVRASIAGRLTRVEMFGV